MLTLKMDVEANGMTYDAEVRGEGVLPSGESVLIVTKSKGTEGGQAVVLVKFDVQLPDGTIAKAQYTFTAREFISAAQAVQGAHPQPADLDKPPTAKPGTVIQKFHRGVGWTALMVEKAYLISVEGRREVSIAFSDEEMLKMGPLAVDKALGII